MMLFLSKGAPYIKENKKEVWFNGKIIDITETQFMLWKFFYGEIKSYEHLLKYMGKLCANGYLITKSLMQQTVVQLESLGILSHTAGDSDEDRFIILLSNKIIPINKNEIKDEFDLKYYELISKYQSMSLADIIANENNLEYDSLTNGYDLEYLKFVYSKICMYSLPKIIINSILGMVKKGNLCIC